MINALRFTEELEKAGFTSEQAKKSVDTWMSLINENFATKSDLREFQFATKADLRELQVEIREVESRLEGQIREFESRLVGQIRAVENKLENQIKDLRTELQLISSRIVIQLGGLMTVLMTIAVSVIAMMK